ncbi:hydroxyisourate hydrolase [Kitasatospora aureofaciens]|uniref:5-hydroxyisourate hydrolase n=1 Tax=Kitasatospora aureofaciens TaxID=1894 RepID=A0A1E7NDA0_KITAU|nr:hydroxyisourate hydrolase [Kitasatospora aureofaciens]QEU98898.1 hydroxyisourate hydrolase [Streptomyces viridifaciens]ARF77706.1 5-hydroxyisourate hydrolase [Kitasatospora aureofaciens]OEV38672.1 hydroxyisourate hydrolase [Kitasatospora aureofaciens]UKZ04908.1 hydroxyisourate hydrolase [Streptomyces viridifaciens]GGU74616.1 5-hydroxyisourate hydrolase [Kitasatospora aureofaciens]
MTGISTHVLDTSLGRPAEGVPVELALHTEGGWQVLGTSATDSDGRVKDLPAVEAGSVVRLLFDTAAYYARKSEEPPFFPEVSIVFTVAPAQHHYHVPLLLNPFGYSVYRGS